MFDDGGEDVKRIVTNSPQLLGLRSDLCGVGGGDADVGDRHGGWGCEEVTHRRRQERKEGRGWAVQLWDSRGGDAQGERDGNKRLEQAVGLAVPTRICDRG